MEYKEYLNKLNWREWQMKKTEILLRDNFTCTHCQSQEDCANFQVHHGYYHKDKDPWDYPSESLHTLCDPCHDLVKKVQAELKELMGVLTVEELIKLADFLRKKQQEKLSSEAKK